MLPLSTPPSNLNLVRPEPLRDRRVLELGSLTHSVLQQSGLSDHDSVVDAEPGGSDVRGDEGGRGKRESAARLLVFSFDV